METGRQAFVLFFAFFWAVAISLTGRYQPFDTASMWKNDQMAIRRFIVSIIILNILPILWFVIIYIIIPNDSNILTIIVAAISSLSAFGFHRILHAFVASDSEYSKYYTDKQIEEVRGRGEFTQDQSFPAHFVPGMLYIIIPGVLALICKII